MPHGIADTRTYQRLYNPLVLRCDRGSVTKASGVLAGGGEMKRKTAYKIAILALEEKQQRHYAFDHHMHLLLEKAGYPDEPGLSAHKNYVRIEEAIEILEAERDHEQLFIFLKAEG